MIHQISRQPAKYKTTGTRPDRYGGIRKSAHAQIAIDPAHTGREYWTGTEAEEEHAKPEGGVGVVGE